MKRLFYEIVGRFTILAICVAFIGLPMVSLPAAITFLCLLVIVIFSDWRFEMARVDRWLAIVILLGVAAKFIPQIEIQEGHNLLLPIGDTEAALHQALPPTVYQYAVARFDDTYPPAEWCTLVTNPGCWRKWGSIRRPFAFSADGAFQHPLYSRVVHGIDFEDVRSFRGGFLNSTAVDDMGDLETGWWDGDATLADPVRPVMPFFVVYELPPSVDGLPLCWSGDVFFGDRDGKIEHAFSRLPSCRGLGGAVRLYGLSINPRYPLSIHLEDRATLPDVAQWLRDVLTLSGAVATVFLFLAPRWLSVVGLGVSAGFVLLLGEAEPYWRLGGNGLYRTLADPVFIGGGDALGYWGDGRVILEQAAAGHWYEALRGVESVYYGMPGYRYFHAVEMALFGERAMLSLAALAVYPYCLYSLGRRLMDAQVALLATGLYFLIIMTPYVAPLTGWSEEGALGMIMGLSENVAYPCAIMGLILAVDSKGLSWQNAPPRLFGSALLLAVSVFMRPNLILAAVVLLFFLWWLRRNEAPVRTALLLAAGFLPVLGMLTHNLFFGGRAVPFILVNDLPENWPAPPPLYLHAFMSLVAGSWADPSIAIVRRQVCEWATGEGGAVFLVLGGAFAASSGFLLRFKVGQFWRRLRSGIRLEHAMVAVYALGLHAVLLCTHPAQRYALLAGNLTYVLVAAACAAIWQKKAHPAASTVDRLWQTTCKRAARWYCDPLTTDLPL